MHGVSRPSLPNNVGRLMLLSGLHGHMQMLIEVPNLFSLCDQWLECTAWPPALDTRIQPPNIRIPAQLLLETGAPRTSLR